jgi:hypothetical protein
MDKHPILSDVGLALSEFGIEGERRENSTRRCSTPCNIHAIHLDQYPTNTPIPIVILHVYEWCDLSFTLAQTSALVPAGARVPLGQVSELDNILPSPLLFLHLLHLRLHLQLRPSPRLRRQVTTLP